MIKFTSVEYKNFRSIGNHPIKIDLTRSHTTMVAGPNGSGKCVDKNTEVEIDIENPHIKRLFLDMVNEE